MTSKNDITGDPIISKSGGKDYNDGWDKIWGKNQKEKQKAMTELNYDGDFKGWSHYCEQEKTLLEVESGYPCNWCGKKELDN
jgi:hypothetical protein